MKPDSSVDKFIDCLLVDVTYPYHYDLNLISFGMNFCSVRTLDNDGDTITTIGQVDKIIRITDLDITMYPGHTYVCQYKRRFGHLSLYLDNVEEKQD